jgi:hypothetical protein
MDRVKIAMKALEKMGMGLGKPPLPQPPSALPKPLAMPQKPMSPMAPPGVNAQAPQATIAPVPTGGWDMTKSHWMR